MARPLGAFAMVNCTSPAYLAHHGTPTRSADLTTYQVVNNAETYIACAPAMPVHLLYPHRRHLLQRMQVFAQWLQALLAPHCAAGA